MKITVSTIPHKKQDYPTVGNWKNKKRTTEIFVSRMKDERFEFLVALHEMVEAYLCRTRGITEQEVTKFDKNFEKNREDGNFDEPGNAPEAPYHNEHLFATHIEQLMADELDVDWDEYDKYVSGL